MIVFDHLTKEYRLGRERHNLRAAVPGRWGEPRGGDPFLALDDVSLEVGQGQAIGVIGRNGAGKSTLLKALAGVVEPTSGEIRFKGTLAAVLELGVGFHEDLTGEENVMMAGTLFGLSRAEVKRRYDQIVDFSGIGEFMTTPVKRYSSGMVARLGFAIAANVDADILAIDEALSVGDIDFRRRSAERVFDLRRQGVTLLFVSHDLFITSQLCDRLVHLDHGRVVALGETAEVLEGYTEAAEADQPADAERLRLRKPIDPADAAAIRLAAPEVHPREIDPGDGLEIVCNIEVDRAVDADLTLSLYAAGSRVVMARWIIDPTDVLRRAGRWSVRIEIPSFNVSPGTFTAVLAAVPVGAVIEEDQRYLEALHTVSTHFTIRGAIATMPGLVLPTTWRLYDHREALVEAAPGKAPGRWHDPDPALATDPAPRRPDRRRR